MTIKHALLVTMMLSPTFALANDSIYTNLHGKDCQLTMSNHQNPNYATYTCKGIGKYSIHVFNEGKKQQIGLYNSDNKEEFFLNGFADVTVGKKAEWRVIKTKEGQTIPVALIVRLKPLNGSSSSLVVSKITTERMCVVDRISSQVAQNELARKSADNAKNKVCLVADPGGY